MPTQWYRVPYVPDPRMHGGNAKTLAFNLAAERFQDQLAAVNGFWAESQLTPTDALVKVRGPMALLNAIALTYPTVADPAALWSPTYEPVTGMVCPAKPWQQVDAEVMDDATFAAAQTTYDTYVSLAISQGYVRLPSTMPPILKRYILIKAGQQGYGLNRISPGTFPTNTTVLDAFTRADEDPTAGWTALGTVQFGGSKIVSNVVLSNAVDGGGGIGAPTSYGPDAEAYATYGVTPAGYCGPILRGSNLGGTTGVLNLYFCGSFGGLNNWFLYKVVAGAYVQLGTTQTGAAPAVGEKVGGDIIGTTLSVYHYTSGAWATRYTQSPTDFSSAGACGLLMTGTDSFDDFVGGTMVNFIPSQTSPMVGRRYV